MSPVLVRSVREVVVQGAHVYVVACPECNAMGPASLAGESRDDAH